MGLAHILGLDDGRQRWLCRSCGRFVTIEAETEDGGADGSPTDEPGDPECPNCGSRDMRRIALF